MHDISFVRNVGRHRQGANTGAMNILNGGDEWDKIASKFKPLANGKLSVDDLQKVQKEFFETVNLPWLKDAIARGDQIRLVSDPNDVSLLYNNGNINDGLSSFGMEIEYLINEGYEFINGIAVKKQ
ncbi:MAG: hypothetical protein IT265_16440 [Saprospiraceae bacterium]|nr:hypothetical protein [Saprospiraceae bacterium]